MVVDLNRGRWYDSKYLALPTGAFGFRFSSALFSDVSENKHRKNVIFRFGQTLALNISFSNKISVNFNLCLSIESSLDII